MEQAPNYKKEIEEIIREFECPKGFRCYKSGFKLLCRARDIGMESFLECLEEAPRSCRFSLPFDIGHLCECPLRIYVSKKLGK
jgi:hypothetical protein